MAELRTKPDSSKVFIFSGLTDNVRKELSKKVLQLGAKSLDLKDFKTYCTHIITEKLNKSEKVLGGLATGKWILHPNYINHSAVAECWLDEEQYEFCDEQIMQQFPRADTELFYAPRRWRFMLGEHAYAFTGWKVAVVAGAKKAVVIKRLLISGGAEVYNLKLPIKRPDKVADMIGYVFVSEQNVASVTSLLEHGVLCLKPEYIGDYLIKDPQPDVMSYLAQFNETTQSDNRDVLTSSQDQTSEASFLALSQTYSPSPIPNTDYRHVTSTPSSPLVRPEAVTTYKSSSNSQITKSSSCTSRTIKTEKSALEKMDTTTPVSDIIDLTQTDSDTDNTREISTLQPSSRKSKRIQSFGGENSPVWKSLIPRSKTPVPCTAVDDEGKQPSSAREDGEPTSISSGTPKQGRFLACPPSSATVDGNQARSGTINGSQSKPEDVLKPWHRRLCTNVPTAIDDTSMDTDEDNSRDSQPSGRKSLRLQSFGGENSPVWKSLIPRSKTPVPCTAAAVDDEGKKFNPTREDGEPTSINSGTPKPHNQRLHELPTVTSPITNFFKPLSVTKEKQEVNILDEVKKAMATWSPVVKLKRMDDCQQLTDNCKENGEAGVLPVERRKLRARKRLSTQEQQNTKDNKELNGQSNFFVPRAPLTGDTCKINTVESIELSVLEEELPNKAGSSTDNNIAVTSKEQTVPTKRKNSHLAEVMLNMKKQKISACEWIPMTYAYNDRERETTEDSLFLPITTVEIIHSMLDDDYTILALNELYKRVSLSCLPPARMLNIVLFKILQNASTEMEANLAYEVFMKVLRLHPPITDSLQKVYLDVLSPNTGDDTSIGGEWECILELIYSIMQEESVQKKHNLRLMLDTIKYMLLQNVQKFLLHKSHDHADLGTKPMILKIMWGPSYYVMFNSRCRQLLDAMTQTITLYRTETDSQKKQSLYDLLKDIMWLVAMVTETCRITECGWMSGLYCLSGERTSIFVNEISKRLIDADIKDPLLLQGLLSMLQLPWLCVSICQQILKTFDDYLLTDEQSLDVKKVTLTHIVKSYIFLLPRFHHEMDTKKPIENTHRQKKKPLKDLSQNNKENHVEHRAMLSKVNKRNSKGETALHTACIKNDVMSVKRLLKIPGIDVNVKDNAEWTPLHEACNHGNIECVQELLKFVPSKTVDLYFTDGTRRNKRADLLAGNNEGITPLHDAVLNNRLEVCRVLLQHGGPRLLSAQTCRGYTALDFAETDEMYQVLSAVLPSKPRRSDSQDLSLMDSQGSTSSLDDYRSNVPNDLLYNEVLYSAGKRLYTHTNSLRQYLHLILIMITNYLHATNLRSIPEQLLAKQTDTPSSVSKESNQSVIVREEHGSETKVSSQEIQEMKRDLQIVKRLPHHLDLFKSHLLKLCQPEDCDVIQTEFLSLQMLAENLET